jgi:AcrR family transcriptional regulator
MTTALYSSTFILMDSSRRTPRQARSKVTVRRILDAAASVLQERGYDGFTTNRIAEVAGLSPGSLYQYFPNKDAILNAMVAEYREWLARRVSTNLKHVLRRESAAVAPEAVVHGAVAAHVGVLLERPEVLNVIWTKLPGSFRVDAFKPIEKLIGDLIRRYAVELRDRPADMDVDTATWIITHLFGVTIRYVVDQPPIAKDTFINEMTRLVLAHPIARAAALD